MTPPPSIALHVDTATGRLRGVRQVLSAHQDARPAGVLPELIIVHGISLPPGEYGGPWIDRLFTGGLPPDAHPYFAPIAAVRVSAHLLVRRDGALVQYVPFHARAWHAGVSEYQGRTGCNDFSIGIELEGTDDAAYEPAQYQALAAAIRALLRAYPGLHRDRVVGHSDVAPGRKTDPGLSFDWARLRADVARGDRAQGDS
jgi:AmpD protein